MTHTLLTVMHTHTVYTNTHTVYSVTHNVYSVTHCLQYQTRTVYSTIHMHTVYCTTHTIYDTITTLFTVPPTHCLQYYAHCLQYYTQTVYNTTHTHTLLTTGGCLREINVSQIAPYQYLRKCKRCQRPRYSTLQQLLMRGPCVSTKLNNFQLSCLKIIDHYTLSATPSLKKIKKNKNCFFDILGE